MDIVSQSKGTRANHLVDVSQVKYPGQSCPKSKECPEVAEGGGTCYFKDGPGLGTGALRPLRNVTELLKNLGT